MEQEITLNVQFNRALNGPEQNTFYTKIVNCLRQVRAFGGGRQDIFYLSWDIT